MVATDPRARTTGQTFECETIEQYRERYAVYKSDPLLQAAHALVPWVVTWDDHEVDNDYAGASSDLDVAPDAFLARRAAGYQVWYEHMPVRLDPPTGPDFDIYRSFAHGDLRALPRARHPSVPGRPAARGAVRGGPR